MNAAVAAYRQIIVLMDDQGGLDDDTRERVHMSASILFETNSLRLEKLEQALREDLAEKDASLTEEFLARLESDVEFRDADKLAFRDVLDDIASLSQEAVARDPLRKRIADDATAIE